ncbi:MAG: hypothetical protein GKR91_02120 [Pseudomonadales bacterium]|nr:hypothetical protein [Pseudomonadales bacterium]
MYISNRSKGRLAVLMRSEKQAQKTIQNKLQDNTMGSDIQSLVLSTIAIRRSDSIRGQTPPENKNESKKTNQLFALPTSEFQNIPCNYASLLA